MILLSVCENRYRQGRTSIMGDYEIPLIRLQRNRRQQGFGKGSGSRQVVHRVNFF